jgi:hypothetical protein
VQEKASRSVTKIEVLTMHHHLVGYVLTGGRRFSTWLNMGDTPTLTLENAALKSLHDVQRSDVNLEYVLVNRDAMLAVIPREAPVLSLGRDQEQKPLEYVEKERHEVVVSLAGFALRGYMHLAKSADLQRALVSFSGDFMPVTEARIVYTPNPGLLWQGDTILINRDKAELYWPAPKERKV